MKIWIGGELKNDIGEPFRIIRNTIEKDLNAHLLKIGYTNVIEKWRVIVILRDDDWSPELEARKQRGENIISMRLKIPYRAFRDGDDSLRNFAQP